ncbi:MULTISPECIES: tape measure protein [Rhizobium/Agrobacterium group]|uniref:Tail component of prophage protein n=2 Tax=Rhizobium/Agrobacterium group TaxID=227290 RepID=B9JVY9_ALLAM|nr:MULTISPECIES: tape measure protein [Rhizobium/Agrobacterium group]ACM36419.1 tail component of prophage protein [Allorhizobium ampelinum S4]MUO27689.1 tape measure protein [Agrobacterium vitis]MUO44252.1 tape measure protein [Agrobacterium vitis]MUP12301.1 tape measure protein [Agrobacterium vitis]
MATDLEKLVVQLSADIKGYQREMQKAAGVTNAQARAIENRLKKMDGQFSALGTSMARGLITPIAGISAALTVDSVIHYADAWTSAKNSLAVAGVVGTNQVSVLDQIYNSAQRNAAPIGAMADLFGKAAQSGDSLGASQADLLKFTDGVGTALKIEGKSATEAQGALTQLGQLLGSTRVQAEEFNSVNEGARPILIAVANGLSAAGGSVSKLKQLVNDGKVSNQEFFQSFLKGLPTIQGMAANATQTIEQGVTKVNNAFTRYIGQTDESLGASQRLVAGLNALADNFEQTADVVLKLASVIAAALVGRSIALMIANLGLATAAVVRLVAALRAASSMAGIATAISGIGAAAGPLGLIIGGTVVGALALFASGSGEAGQAADRFSERLKRVGEAAEESAEKVDKARQSYNAVKENQLAQEAKVAASSLKSTSDETINLLSYFAKMRESNLITPEQATELERLRDGIKTGSVSADDARQSLAKMATADYNFQQIADAIDPILKKLTTISVAAQQTASDLAAVQSAKVMSPEQVAGYKQYAQSRKQGEEMLRIGKAYADEAQRQNTLSKEQLAIEGKRAKIKADLAKTGGVLPDDKITSLAIAEVKADERRSDTGKTTAAPRATADDRLDMDIQSIRDRTAALVEEQAVVGQSYRQQEKRRMALDLEQQALQDVREEARRKGDADWQNAKLAPEQIAKINAASDAYAEQADILRKVEDAQQRSQQAAQEFYDTAKSAFSDVIMGAESFSDALSGVLKKLGELALNSAFDGLFGGSSATSSGGWLTGFAKAIGFADGGYTGAGGKYEPAGVVHKGEYVFDADAVRKAGGPAGLDAMRKRLKGYSSGGYVGPSAPRMPDLSRAAASKASSVQISINPVIDNRGASVEAVARQEQAMNKLQKTLPAQIITAVRDARARGVKV